MIKDFLKSLQFIYLAFITDLIRLLGIGLKLAKNHLKIA